jgi:threonine dehydrogenase-like Zn-dependent dehydrogenase
MSAPVPSARRRPSACRAATNRKARQIMKALVFNGPWNLSLEDVPEPVPGPAEVLLRVAATGICGSDIHGYAGRTGRRHPGQVMGHETAAWVEALAENGPSGLHVGDLVTVNPVIGCGQCPDCADGRSYVCASRTVIGVSPARTAAFAEYLAAPLANVIKLGDGVTPRLGALVEPLAVGYHAAIRGRCGDRDRVLVVGGGPIGQACALAARRLGAVTAILEPDERRQELLRELGFDAVMHPDADHADATEALGGPATVVMDAVGSTESLRSATERSAVQARIVLVGMHSPTVELQAYPISTQERELIGSFSYSAGEFAETAAWLSQHLELGSLVQEEVGWSAAPEAFRKLAAGEATASKILVVPAKDEPA